MSLRSSPIDLCADSEAAALEGTMAAIQNRNKRDVVNGQKGLLRAR
jgi:hypothetical protein